MANVTHKLSNALEGALAGGGDPATSPLYVFGPFLKLIFAAGVAQITFGASVWLVVVTIALVSAMYRLVMIWITDGSGGSGLGEEEFGSWAVKLNAGITFVEYTLTFLVSMAALVTFVADRFPALNQPFLVFQYRTLLAIGLSFATGWLVNRGPKVAARAFGPATAGVLLLLWLMIFATIWKLGLHLPKLDLAAFKPGNLRYTIGGYVRILAVMTGIEIFANLVAAYDGSSRQKSRKAFNSLLIIMGTTSATMLIVGPAIFQLSDPTNAEVSVFTQTMDQLLPAPLAWLGTIVGVLVLLSASAASSQGLQNLALGLKLRHYIPAVAGQRNRYEVAPVPVGIQVGIVSLCFLTLGTHEETYLAIYAAGVFVLLSLTGWAAAKRLRRISRGDKSWRHFTALVGTAAAATLTSAATVIIFVDRFSEGAWTYFLFLPLLYFLFSAFRRRLGEPTDRVNELVPELPDSRHAPRPGGESAPFRLERVLVPLDGSGRAEQALPLALEMCRPNDGRLMLMSAFEGREPGGRPTLRRTSRLNGDYRMIESYLSQVTNRMNQTGFKTVFAVGNGRPAEAITATARSNQVDLMVMSARARSGVGSILSDNVANQVAQISDIPLLLVRPIGKGRTGFQRLLVALDGSFCAEAALPYAGWLATHFGKDVLLLSVMEGTETVEQLASRHRYLDSVAASFEIPGLKVRPVVKFADPANAILQAADSEAIDLIVLAARVKSRQDRWMLGSVAGTVINNTNQPVFLVPRK